MLETYTLLEEGQVILSEGIGLGNNRNQIDASTETLHDLNVKRLEATKRETSA